MIGFCFLGCRLSGSVRKPACESRICTHRATCGRASDVRLELERSNYGIADLTSFGIVALFRSIQLSPFCFFEVSLELCYVLGVRLWQRRKWRRHSRRSRCLSIAFILYAALSPVGQATLMCTA